MTKDEFLNSTINLQELYNKKLNETQLEFWYDELKIYDIDKYKRTIGEFAKSQKTFPALSEVLNKIRNLQDITMVKPIDEVKKVKCDTCHGTGLVKYIKREGCINYDYYCLCFCENGKRLDYPLKKYEEVFYYRKPEPAFKVDAIDYDISQINF